MDVGGRYHTTQVDLSGCSGAVFEALLAKDEEDACVFTLSPLISFPESFSRLSTELEPKSRAVPGDLGVLADDPKDANAPEPSPNAEEAPAVGEATLVVDEDSVLKGLGLPCEDVSPPKRLEDEKVRGESVLWFSFGLFGFEVERESLLELQAQVSRQRSREY